MLSKLSKDKNWIFLVSLIFLCLILFLYKLGSYSLFDVDEPRYAEAAREMIESNNWITPYFNYVVRFEKPVLFYWLIAFAYKLLGVNEFAARLPSAIMAMLIVFSVFFFSKKLVNASFAFISSIIIATSFQFIALGRMSITDMTLAAFICLMLLSGFTAINSEAKSKNIFWYLFYIFMALGTLTKGPVVPLFALIIFIPYTILIGKFKQTFKSCQLIKGSLLYLSIALPWYIMVILQNGHAYIDQFFLTDNFKRFTSTVSGHKGPIYYFIPVVAIGFLPWSAFLPIFLLRYIKNIKALLSPKNTTHNSSNILINKFTTFRNYYKSASAYEHLILFAFLWFIIIFCFFSFSGTKLLTYILPLFPAMGILIGSLFHNYLSDYNNKDNKTFAYSFYALFAAVLIGVYFIFYNINLILPRDIDVISIEHIKIPLIIGLVSLSLLTLILNIMNKRLYAFGMIIINVIFIITFSVSMVVPVFNLAAQETLNKIAHLSSLYPENPKITVTYGVVKPSLTFYSRKKIHFVPNNEQTKLLEFINSNKRVFIITRKKFVDNMPQNKPLHFIFGDDRFVLYTNKPFDKIITANLLRKSYESTFNRTINPNNS